MNGEYGCNKCGATIIENPIEGVTYPCRCSKCGHEFIFTVFYDEKKYEDFCKMTANKNEPLDLTMNSEDLELFKEIVDKENYLMSTIFVPNTPDQQSA